MDEDLKILIPEDKFLLIGKKRFKIWISSERSLKATALFNKIVQKGTDENKAIETDYDYYVSMLDVVMLLIKQDFIPVMKKYFSIKTVTSWVSRERLKKEYILKYMDIKELASFIDDALDPIIGTKKKILERQEKVEDAMLIILETITAEELSRLLLSSLQGPDIKKVM